MTTVKKNLTPLLAYPKIKHYCGYSERCHHDVREKLFGMGLVKKDVEILISRLIEEDYLNEERFAILFAGGHFRQKKWGKTKIVHALRQKRVSEQTKWKSLKAEHYITREAKTVAFLMQRGYESPAIRHVIAGIRLEIKNNH